MKVIAINGSPKKEGNTYYSLKTVCDTLNENGIETEIIHIGNKPIRGCMACGKCEDCRCAFEGDDFYNAVKKMADADGILLGSPVYYAGISGTMKAFLDKAFSTGSKNFRLKVGAATVSPRRAGGMDAFNQLNNYFLISEMIVAPSYYWNISYGAAPGDVLRDEEAMCVLNTLGRNMAWLLQKTAGTKDFPEVIEHKRLNMVR